MSTLPLNVEHFTFLKYSSPRQCNTREADACTRPRKLDRHIRRESVTYQRPNRTKLRTSRIWITFTFTPNLTPHGNHTPTNSEDFYSEPEARHLLFASFEISHCSTGTRLACRMATFFLHFHC